jgi:hypothetical protein
MHLLGQKCHQCGKKGLIIGADDGFNFRPEGWLIKRLEGRLLACPHCGAVVAALLPESLKKLAEVLRTERHTEKVTYHARAKRRKRPPPPPAPKTPTDNSST